MALFLEKPPAPAAVPEEPASYYFGEFMLDVERRLLYSGSSSTTLPERLFVLLLVLLEANGQVVDRDTISSRVWDEKGTTDANLTQHIYLLRMLLGERKRQRSAVVTVPGRGYRFALPVTRGETPLAGSPAPGRGDADRAVGVETLRRYCRARSLLTAHTATALREAIAELSETLAQAPRYVPALVTLARAYVLLARYGYVPAGGALSAARSATFQALQTEPGAAAAHALLGELFLFADWNWSKAEDAITTALNTAPHSTFARESAATFFVCRGDVRTALHHARRAVELEPFSTSHMLLLAETFVRAGDHESALWASGEIAANDTAGAAARRCRAEAYLLAGRPAQALEELRPAGDRNEHLAFEGPLAARAYAHLGAADLATELYDGLCAADAAEHVTQWNLALVAMALARPHDALDHLKIAFERREPSLAFLRTARSFEPLSGSLRFRQIVRDVCGVSQP